MNFLDHLTESERTAITSRLQLRKEEKMNISPDIADDSEQNENVKPIRRHMPGDILDVVRKLRTLLSVCETTGYTLYAGFSEIDSSLDQEASKARHTLELATARVMTFLEKIENTEYYRELRAEVLAQRKVSPSGKV